MSGAQVATSLQVNLAKRRLRDNFQRPLFRSGKLILAKTNKRWRGCDSRGKKQYVASFVGAGATDSPISVPIFGQN
jgi:hypothetical protein